MTMPLADWLTTSPAYEGHVAQRLIELVAPLRTMTTWTALTIKLPAEVTLPEPSRRVQRLGNRWLHTYNLAGEDALTSDLMSMVEGAYDVDA